jgi:MFS transporter, ACS family, hexuronate transporter
VTGQVSRYRWVLLAVFVLSTVINYLDRLTLSALGPEITREFGLSISQYLSIVSVFALAYAVTAPFAGLLIDGIGLNRAISLAVALWSGAGIATGFTSGLAGLAGCRGVLGLAEAAGIPGAAKAIHQYLLPGERALGNALNQVAVSVGAALAPPLATWIAVRYGWRGAFAATGALGLLWIPLWNILARWVPAAPAPRLEPGAGREVLRDPVLWLFVLANAVSMFGYWVWTTLTTFYLVDVHHLTVAQANGYAWVPPVFAGAGGLAGGWLSLALVKRGLAPATARYRACLAGAVVSLVTAAIPEAPSAGWACAGISVSFLAVAGFSVNMYSLPLDIFGGARAAFAVSMLVASYGAMQFVLAGPVGWIIQRYGYTPVTLVSAITPLAACGVLGVTRSLRSSNG